MHPIIGTYIALDHTASLIREADGERLAALARPRASRRPRTWSSIRRNAAGLIRLGGRRTVGGGQ